MNGLLKKIFGFIRREGKDKQEQKEIVIYISDCLSQREKLTRAEEQFWEENPQTPLHFVSGEDETYFFQDDETRKKFERILKNLGVNYALKKPVEPKRRIPPKLKESGFNNNASLQGFICGYNSIEEIIACDTRELEKIGGSFEEIADRMEELVNYAREKKQILRDEEQSEWIEPVFERFKRKYGSLNGFSPKRNPKAWQKYMQEWAERMARHPKTRYDEKVSVLQIIETRGFQECPFKGCETYWNEEVIIYNPKTKKILIINRGTVHLARVHHLLEKGNEYGITAREFYENFMPNKSGERK
ncbi:MAG: hypothetical protein QW622_02245 [Candidatus Pacearchaeota archaeon]